MSDSAFKLIVRQTITPGGIDEFRRCSQLGAGNAEANEPGTLGYEFFVNEDGTESYLVEYYADSQSFLTHFANVQPILEAAMKVSGMVEAVVLGDPTPEARTMLAALGVKYYPERIGFCR